MPDSSFLVASHSVDPHVILSSPQVTQSSTVQVRPFFLLKESFHSDWLIGVGSKNVKTQLENFYLCVLTPNWLIWTSSAHPHVSALQSLHLRLWPFPFFAPSFCLRRAAQNPGWLVYLETQRAASPPLRLPRVHSSYSHMRTWVTSRPGASRRELQRNTHLHDGCWRRVATRMP